jgi:C-terminal processing protease CtpA/Prc
MNDLDRDDWFSVYINSITSGYDPHTNYFAPEERFDVSISGKLEGIGARLKEKMTLPKYLNLFQEVRLGAENSLKRRLNNESGSRKWVAC